MSLGHSQGLNANSELDASVFRVAGAPSVESKDQEKHRRRTLSSCATTAALHKPLFGRRSFDWKSVCGVLVSFKGSCMHDFVDRIQLTVAELGRYPPLRRRRVHEHLLVVFPRAVLHRQGRTVAIVKLRVK